ncbi:GL16048 [Drosophila persimilis]|uniref:GL16048 n=1 Tax=Drosophila persimilis TaxID=7234 RepID=B4IRK8_DROPE|nr:GL16048 [Drosophila persimilis]
MSTRHLWFGARLCGHSTAYWLRPRPQQVIVAAMSSSKGWRPAADIKHSLPRNAASKTKRRSKRTAAAASEDPAKDQPPAGRKIHKKIHRTTLGPPTRNLASLPSSGFLAPLPSHFGGLIAYFSSHSGGEGDVPPPSDAPPTRPRRGSIARGFPVTPGVRAEARPPKAPRFSPSGLPSVPSIEPEAPREAPATELSEESPSNPEGTQPAAPAEQSTADPETGDAPQPSEAPSSPSGDPPTPETAAKPSADPPTLNLYGLEVDIYPDLRPASEESPKVDSPGGESPRKGAPDTPKARENPKPPLFSGVKPPPKGTRTYCSPPKKPKGPYSAPEPTPKGPLFSPKRAKAAPTDKSASKAKGACTPAPAASKKEAKAGRTSANVLQASSRWKPRRA